MGWIYISGGGSEGFDDGRALRCRGEKARESGAGAGDMLSVGVNQFSHHLKCVTTNNLETDLYRTTGDKYILRLEDSCAIVTRSLRVSQIAQQQRLYPGTTAMATGM